MAEPTLKEPDDFARFGVLVDDSSDDFSRFGKPLDDVPDLARFGKPVDAGTPSMRAAFAAPGENPVFAERKPAPSLLEIESQRIAPKTLTEAEVQKADIALGEAMAEPVGGALPESVKGAVSSLIKVSLPPYLGADVKEGVSEALIELEEGLRSVPGLTMGAAVLMPGSPGSIAKIALSGIMAKGFGESLAELERASAAGEKKAAAKAAVNSFVSGLGMAGLGRAVGAEMLAKPPVIPGAVPIPPEAPGTRITAEALKAQQAALEPNQKVSIVPESTEIVPPKPESVPKQPRIVSPEPEIVPKQPEIVGMGGAVPEELKPPPSGPTSIKNAQVDIERAQRGLPEVVQPARRGFGEVWDRAMAEIDRDATIQERLVNELREKPRALTDTEDAILLHRQITLQNEYAKAARDLSKAYDDGLMDAVTLEQARVEGISNQLLDVYEIGKKVGTETGRGLAARKMMANEDFTLASLEMQKRADIGGRPLTEIERAELVKVAEEYRTKSEALEKRLAEVEGKLTESQAKEIKIHQSVIDYADKLVSRMETASERYAKEIYGQFNSPTPDVLAKAAFIGATKIARGVVELAKWTDEMVAQLGEGFRKHAAEVYKASQEQLAKELDADKIGRRIKAQVSTPKTRDQINLQSFKTRTAAKIIELQERMAKGDFGKRAKRETPLDARATELKFELEKVKQRWLEARFRDQLAREPARKKIFRTTQEALNFSRAVITSADFSAVLRQGGFITLGHPIRAARAIGPMLRALASEKAQFEVMEQIRANPNYNLAKQSGLYLAEDSPLSLNKLEEAYMSRWASKVPGVAASQRAYTTFLNKLRMDSFDGMVKSLSKTGTPTELEAQVIANYINVATGRGNIGKANQMAVGLNTVFFSPRLVASRFQLLAGQPLYRGTLRTRKLIAGEYARFLGGMALVYGLAQLADWDVEFDRRSSDFGKIRIGNTRIDPLTGLAQVTVLLSRLTSGETKSIRGQVTPIRGDVPFGKPDATDVMKSFLRTKLSPAFGTAVDILAGSNVVGEPTTPGSVAEKLLVPMSFDDIYRAMQEQGIPKGTAIALLSLLGMGVQTFDENKPKPERPK